MAAAALVMAACGGATRRSVPSIDALPSTNAPSLATPATPGAADPATAAASTSATTARPCLRATSSTGDARNSATARSHCRVVLPYPGDARRGQKRMGRGGRRKTERRGVSAGRAYRARAAAPAPWRSPRAWPPGPRQSRARPALGTSIRAAPRRTGRARRLAGRRPREKRSFAVSTITRAPRCSGSRAAISSSTATVTRSASAIASEVIASSTNAVGPVSPRSSAVATANGIENFACSWFCGRDSVSRAAAGYVSTRTDSTAAASNPSGRAAMASSVGWVYRHAAWILK